MDFLALGRVKDRKEKKLFFSLQKQGGPYGNSVKPRLDNNSIILYFTVCTTLC